MDKQNQIDFPQLFEWLERTMQLIKGIIGDSPWLTGEGVMARFHFRNRSVLKKMRELGMPAHPRPGMSSGKRPTLLYHVDEIDEWMLNQESPEKRIRRKAREIVEAPIRRRRKR